MYYALALIVMLSIVCIIKRDQLFATTDAVVMPFEIMIVHTIDRARKLSPAYNKEITLAATYMLMPANERTKAQASLFYAMCTSKGYTINTCKGDYMRTALTDAYARMH